MTQLGTKSESLKLQATSSGDYRSFSKRKISAILSNDIGICPVSAFLGISLQILFQGLSKKENITAFFIRNEEMRHVKQAKLMVNNAVVVMY